MWQKRADAVHRLDHIGARLTLDVEDDSRLPVEPACNPTILDTVTDRADVPQSDGGAVGIGDDGVAVAFGVETFLVRGDRVGTPRAFELAFGTGEVLPSDGAPHLFEAEPPLGDCGRVDIDSHRAFLAAFDRDEPDPRDL